MTVAMSLGIFIVLGMTLVVLCRLLVAVREALLCRKLRIVSEFRNS